LGKDGNIITINLKSKVLLVINREISKNYIAFSLCCIEFVLLTDCIVYLLEYSIMGGDRSCTKPETCEEFKKNETLWHICHEGGVTSYLECLQGYDENLSD